MTVFEAKFRFRRGTAAQWIEVNPILEPGEPGLEMDTRKLKIGDGTTPWVTLEYCLGSDSPGDPGDPQALQDHIDDPTPHEAYDIDIPSLSVLFENGLV